MNQSAQKFPLSVSINRAAQQQAKDVFSLLGKGLPASIVSIAGRIAVVKIEVLDIYNMPQLTVPVAGSKYTIEPLQPGDMGMLIPANASIASISGQGSVSDLSAQLNLSSLVFLPIGSADWALLDPNTYYATGLDDVMLRDNTHQVSLEGINTAFLSLASQLDALLLVIGPLLTTSTVLTPILTTTNPVVPRV